MKSVDAMVEEMTGMNKHQLYIYVGLSITCVHGPVLKEGCQPCENS